MFKCNKCGKKELGTALTSKGRKGEVRIPKGWKMMFENLSGGTIGKPVCDKCKAIGV